MPNPPKHLIQKVFLVLFGAVLIIALFVLTASRVWNEFSQAIQTR